jgi:hypothetical protein
MVPRTVQMRKEIQSIIGPYEAILGNVLGPQGYGWSNLFPRWFLNGPNTLGTPQISDYFIHHYGVDGTPFYTQPPVRRQSTYGSFLHPIADSSSVPPVANLFEGYLESPPPAMAKW